jgi:Flp pilus assembly protein TadD
MKLGQAQAENDQDKQAISALEQAVALDRTNLEALVSLSVSHVRACLDTY